MISFWMLLVSLASADPLPPPAMPRPGEARPAQPEAGFGADVSLGYSLGTIAAEWIETGTQGSAMFRYDAFTRNRGMTGPRLGMSLWGSMTVGPTPVATETQSDGTVNRVDAPMSHAGVLAVLRHDPEAPISGTFGVGFGRLEIDNYFGGPLVLPAFTLEAGGRHRAPRHSFVDWMVRTHWATSRALAGDTLEEWWFVELAGLVGTHLH